MNRLQPVSEKNERPAAPAPSATTQKSAAPGKKSPDRQKKKDNFLWLFLLLLLLLLLTGIFIWLTSKRLPPVAKASIPVAVVKQIQEVKDTIVRDSAFEKKPVEVNDKERNTRRNWNKYIHASNSSYGYGILGGISNLSVLFSNNSDYLLDEITAKITYIKANGKPWKTKFVTTYHLPPHTDRKESMPKVSRGRSVKVEIYKVISKEMHFSYIPGRRPAVSDDPYFEK